MAKIRTFHLWRRYPEAPFRRWACSVVKDGSPEGYRVSDFDPNVADTGFLHVVGDTLRQPRHVTQQAPDDGFKTAYLTAGDPGHLDAAIRAIPRTFICATGRA